MVSALADEVEAAPSAELVVLLQRAAGHLVKVILRADDSEGTIGNLCRRVLDLHRQACTVGVADPQKLAKWMVKFAFEDQDFFEIDPVGYADALGDKGLAVYRREVAKRSDPADAPEHRSETLRTVYGGFPSFAARYAAERLAIIDRDVDRLVELLGGDLSSPYQFQQVAEAFVELGRPDDALGWARRGIAETSGWQLAKLYDLTAELLTDAGDLDEVVEIRRHHHERMPSASTYAKLQAAAGTVDAWADEIDRARAVLAEHDPAGHIDALLADGEPDEAWAVAVGGDQEILASQWLRLAEAREPTAPGDAMQVYLRLADEVLAQANKRLPRRRPSPQEGPPGVDRRRPDRRVRRPAHGAPGTQPASTLVHGHARQGRAALRPTSRGVAGWTWGSVRHGVEADHLQFAVAVRRRDRGEWEVDRAEQVAAWEMYVELSTRISVVPLDPDDGLLREALASLYTLFGSTRDILRRHGPGVAKVPTTVNDRSDRYSFGYLATWVLNGAVRPTLAKWHPLLDDWEAGRPDGTSRRAHERAWNRHDELRDAVEAVRHVLI
ncbi:MAG: hypothetical protein ACK5PP_04925, partial [Acidimicrobiales bacterium]